jgi:hypothetical protein
MPQIFISYGRADELFCRSLAKDLDDAGGDVWIDVDDIRAGEDWSEAIQAGLDACAVMLLVITPASMQSRRVSDEWKYFSRMGKPLIPILLEPAPVSYEIHSLHYVNFHDQPYDTALRQLKSELWRKGVHFTEAINHPTPLPAQPPLIAGKTAEPFSMIKPPVLQSKAQYNRIESILANVQHEVWISGIALNKITPYRSLFQSLFVQGKTARFMLVDPKATKTVKETSAYVGQTLKQMQRRLEVSLDDLGLLYGAYPATVAIRLMQQRPSVGYFVVDPDTDQGFMTVSPYFYQIDLVNAGGQGNPCCDPPFLHLPRLTEKQWFDVYLEDFKRQWECATLWPGGTA